MSNGLNPATACGIPYSVEKYSKGFVPIIVQTCPGWINAFKVVSPELIRKSIAGGISLWQDSTEKFSGGVERSSAAVVGAVVSNPAEMNATSLSVFSAISIALLIPYTTLTSPPSALASASDLSEPGTLSMSPKVVIVTPLSISSRASSISRDGTTHTGHPGPAMISTSSGSRLLIPFSIIVCSCEPHTCIILTGVAKSLILSINFFDISFILIITPKI